MHYLVRLNRLGRELSKDFRYRWCRDIGSFWVEYDEDTCTFTPLDESFNNCYFHDNELTILESQEDDE